MMHQLNHLPLHVHLLWIWNPVIEIYLLSKLLLCLHRDLSNIFLFCFWGFTRHVDEVDWRRFGTITRLHLSNPRAPIIIVLHNPNIQSFTIITIFYLNWRWNRLSIPKRRQPSSFPRHVKTKKRKNDRCCSFNYSVNLWLNWSHKTNFFLTATFFMFYFVNCAAILFCFSFVIALCAVKRTL
jgi:hypothetical protein